jgi:hypothetical protein
MTRFFILRDELAANFFHHGRYRLNIYLLDLEVTAERD